MNGVIMRIMNGSVGIRFVRIMFGSVFVSLILYIMVVIGILYVMGGIISGSRNISSVKCLLWNCMCVSVYVVGMLSVIDSSMIVLMILMVIYSMFVSWKFFYVFVY